MIGGDASWISHCPRLGEGVYEAELVALAGQARRRGQARPEPDGSHDRQGDDGSAVAVRRHRSPSCSAEPGQQIKVGEVVLTYTPAGRAEPAAAVPRDRASRRRRRSRARAGRNGQRSAVPPRRLPVKAAPSVRQLARKLGIDLTRVHGSGPEGRILVEDLTATSSRASRRAAPATPRRAAARLRHARHAHQAAGPAPQDRRAHGPGQARPSRITPTSTNATSPIWCKLRENAAASRSPRPASS